jgi:hypothetical protein
MVSTPVSPAVQLLENSFAVQLLENNCAVQLLEKRAKRAT